MRTRSAAWSLFSLLWSALLLFGAGLVLATDVSLECAGSAVDSAPFAGVAAASLFTRLKRKGPELPDAVRKRVEERINQLGSYVEHDQEEMAREGGMGPLLRKPAGPDEGGIRGDPRRLIETITLLHTVVEAADARSLSEIGNAVDDCRALLDESDHLLLTTAEKLIMLRDLLDEIVATAALDRAQAEQNPSKTFKPYLIVNK